MRVDSGSNITRLLDDWSQGDRDALGKLMPLVLDDLRRIARNHLARESPGHTLQPTELVHEAYLRIIKRRQVQWRNRAQFFGFLAGLMRCILVDHSRRRQSQRRGGDLIRVALEESVATLDPSRPDLLAVDEALERLAKLDPRQASIVEMRFFAGFKVREIAAALEISTKTVRRDWGIAKLWLARELSIGR